MTETTNHTPGTFCWVDLATTDTTAAKVFYSAVLGWTATDVPTDMGPPYTMFALGDQGVCGAYPLPPGSDHPHWLSYVGVADLDATVAQAQRLGAQVAMPPMDVMEEGRLAVIRDPTGAHLGLWQPRRHLGSALCNAPGAPSWRELQTRDLEGAAAFYQSLFGWTVKPFEGYAKEAGGYGIFVLDGQEVGGMMAIGADWGHDGSTDGSPDGTKVPPNWSTYFGVADCDAAVAAAQGAGGRLLAPVMEIAGVGRFAFLQDPQGAVFAVIAFVGMPG
jgi:predicted enzyme related to lactoylglutathione lyase